MAYILEQKCIKCNGEISVISYKGKKGPVVSHGECINCGRVEILPEEPFLQFVNQFCRKK